MYKTLPFNKKVRIYCAKYYKKYFQNELFSAVKNKLCFDNKINIKT